MAKNPASVALVQVCTTGLKAHRWRYWTKSALVQYLHRCDFSPVVPTWTKAIDAKFFATWPGLKSELLRKHLPKSLATAKGHLKQDRQNIRSTKLSGATAPLVLPIGNPDEIGVAN